MPGSQLMCVWEAVGVLDVNKQHDHEAPKETVKKITSLFSGLQSVHYSDLIFDKTFATESIKFEDYCRYVNKTLREKGVPIGILHDNLEQTCWDIVKKAYSYSIIKEEVVEKLWKICNRLMKEEIYPPVMCREEACWLTEKILGSIGNIFNSTDEMFKEESFSFKSFMKILSDYVMKETTHEKMKTCVDDLHSWLVLEILKKNKVFVRSKKQSNWTTWSKRNCMLTPRGITVFTGSLDKASASENRRELVMTKNTKVETLSKYSGIIHRLDWRFRVSNLPVIEMEIAVEGEAEKRSWLSCLEEVVTSIKENTTPIQKLLRERYSKRIKKTSNQTGSLENLDQALNESHRRSIRKDGADIHKQQSDNKAEKENGKKSDIHVITKSSQQLQINEPESSIVDINRQKLKAVFMKIDQNGNGLLDRDEFSRYLEGLGLQLGEKEKNLIFRSVDTENKGQIKFDQFEHYFAKYVLDETSTAECVNHLRKAFLSADRDGSGTLNFREFTEYMWEKKRSIRMSQVLHSFGKCDKDEITFADFQNMARGSSYNLLESIVEEEPEDGHFSAGQFQNQLKQVYNDTESEELATYIRDRWKKFATFRRQGHTGSIVMQGGHGMVADLVPGEYSLIDLACFSDLPPLVPKHTVVKGVKWVTSTIPGNSGKIVFPADFDGKVVTDVATTELLRYYGCSFADAQQEKVSLLYRHGIQDFTYENGYLEKYVTITNGGSGIERHEFSHLDCPLTADSGTFILAKFEENGDFHITGFKIPIRHTLYVPGGCIHSNDYLTGTWRTMLSDETDIDHVHLTKQKVLSADEDNDNVAENKFQFTFV